MPPDPEQRASPKTSEI